MAFHGFFREEGNTIIDRQRKSNVKKSSKNLALEEDSELAYTGKLYACGWTVEMSI